MKLEEKDKDLIKTTILSTVDKMFEEIEDLDDNLNIEFSLEVNRTIRLHEDIIVRKKSEFKEGQIVKFKTWNELKKQYRHTEDCIYCMFSFPKKMKHLCGTYAVIEHISEKNITLTNFTAKGNTAFSFSTDMIKVV